MIEANVVMNKVFTIKNDIKRLIKETDYFDGEGLSEVNLNLEHPNDIFLNSELNRIFYDLEKAQRRIEYLERPIKYESTLFLNEDGRYETEKGDYFTSGSMIEYLSNDERYSDFPFWKKSSIESDSGTYYIVGEPDLSLSGLLVRVRGE